MSRKSMNGHRSLIRDVAQFCDVAEFARIRVLRVYRQPEFWRISLEFWDLREIPRPEFWRIRLQDVGEFGYSQR